MHDRDDVSLNVDEVAEGSGGVFDGAGASANARASAILFCNGAAAQRLPASGTREFAPMNGTGLNGAFAGEERARRVEECCFASMICRCCSMAWRS